MYTNDSTKTEVSQYYASLSLAVFPCHTVENGGCSCGDEKCESIAKHPLTEHGCKDATTNPETIAQYFSGDYAIANIGIATGKVSGVWVIDEDEDGAVAKLEAVHGPLPPTPTVQTGKGRHLYFRQPDGVSIPNSRCYIADGIDVRGDGGYVIAPPSDHASGKRYRWLTTPDDVPFAVAPDWLVALVTATKTDTANVARLLCNRPYNERANVNDPLTIERAKTVTERAKLYLANTPPAVAGQGGHDHTFFVVCRLCECFGELSDDELLVVLQTWNDRCLPRWTDKELRHKIEQARKQVGNGDVDPINVDEDDNDDWPTLSEDAYCGIVGEIVRAIAPETEADPAGVLVTLLASIGNAIGNGPRITATVGDDHGCNLFVCLVGDTASGKGQSWSICKSLMRSADDGWLNDCVSYGLSSGEGFVERLNDDEGEPVNVFTIKAAKRLLCLETEFARPITAMRRDGNTLSPLLRSAWDGHTLEVMTRGKSKLRATNAHVSIVANITPEELHKLTTGTVEAVNGFVNRFLWCCVRSTRSLPHGGNPDVLTRFVEPLKAAIAKAKTIGRVTRSAEADRVWEDVYPSLKNARCKATERGRSQVLRLAMLFAVLDGNPIIEPQHMRAAIAVWRYCGASAVMLFSSDDPRAETLEAKIRRVVNDHPGIMRSELRDAISHKLKADELTKAIDCLVSWGDIVSVPVVGESGGRPGVQLYPGAKGQKGNNLQPSNEEVIAPKQLLPPTSRTTEEELTVIAPEVNAPVQTQSQTVSEESFMSDIGARTIPATFADLLDWRNANGVDFVRRDGVIWVTTESGLTPSLREAIYANQDSLAMFVPVVVPATEDGFARWLRDEASAETKSLYDELNNL